MKVAGAAVVLISLVSTVFGQRGGDDDESSFVITSMNSGRNRGNNNGNSRNRGDSNRDSDRDSSNRFSGSTNDRFPSNTGDRRNPSRSGASQQFPDFVRIEVEIQRLDNPGGILSNGKKCDFTRSCDPRLMAYLDTSKPLSPWPGSIPEKKWPVIFQASNTNSPTITKSMNVDICGGSVNKVNARVSAHDMDTLFSHDEINKFECLFDINTGAIAMDAGSARWGPSTECKSSAQAGKIRLFARQRAYEIPSTSCRAPSQN